MASCGERFDQVLLPDWYELMSPVHTCNVFNAVLGHEATPRRTNRSVEERALKHANGPVFYPGRRWQHRECADCHLGLLIPSVHYRVDVALLWFWGAGTLPIRYASGRLEGAGRRSVGRAA